MGTRAMRGHRSLVVCSKNLWLQEKLQWRSRAGGSLPPPRCRPGVQPQDMDPRTPWLRLSPLPLARPPVVERRELEPDGSSHLPAHAYGRLGIAAFPVTFNWECSSEAERIQAGERKCPSASLKSRAAAHPCPSETASLFPRRLVRAGRAFVKAGISRGAMRVAGTRAGLRLRTPTHRQKAAQAAPATRLGPVPHSSPRPRRDGDTESSGIEFIPLSQLMEDDQQRGGKFAGSINAG